MKRDIQDQILREMAGLTAEQRRQEVETQILSDPVLGPLWRRSRPTTREDTTENNLRNS